MWHTNMRVPGLCTRFRVVSALSRFGHESFRPWIVSAGSFRPGSFRSDFKVGRFGLFRWVVSVRYTPTSSPIFYDINETALNDKFSFMTPHTSLCMLCSTAVSKESYTVEKDDDTYPNPYKL